MKLTKRVIDGMQYGGGTDYRWDDSLPGFGVRVYASGKKSFVISYRINGRKRFMVLGSYGVLTLAEARQRARRELVRVTDGVDPSTERQDALQAPTLADLALKFKADLPKRRIKKTGRPLRPRTISFYTKFIDNYLIPKLGTAKVTDISRQDVERFHRSFQATPYVANHCLKLLGQLLGFAERLGWRELNTNPCGTVSPFPEVGRARKREVMLRPEQIQRLMEALALEHQNGTDIYALTAIEAAFWLGWRLKSDLLPLKWEDLDLEYKVARLWDTKTADFEYRALPDEAVALFERLPRLDDNPHVFPGKFPGKHRTTVRKIWYRIRERAGLTEIPQLGNYRAHDLRHNAVSWLLASGSSLKMAGAVVGHASEQSTEVYSHFLTEHLAEAANASTKAMLSAASRDKGKE